MDEMLFSAFNATKNVSALVGSFPFKNHSLLRHPEKCAKDKVGETYFWMGLNLILICLTQMDRI